MAENGNGTAVVRSYAAATPAAPFGGDAESFGTAQRIAQALAASTVVPADYRNNLPNVLVAMEYANRIGASVLAVMQNLDVVRGRPSLRATFLIGTVNACGRFTPIRFRFVGAEGTDAWGCRAVAQDRESGEECVGPLITIALAKADGWYSKKDKNGKETSKWQVFPELMLMYRSASWWTRVFAPDLSLGMHATDELDDMRGIDVPARVQTAAALLDAPDAPEESPADQLRRLRQDARDADAIDAQAEESIEAALASEDEDEIRTWITSLESELARLDGARV